MPRSLSTREFISKQGKMSVSASRQYLGRLGKVDRGQVAVFGVLARDNMPQPLIPGSTCPKNGPMTSSDAPKRALPGEQTGLETEKWQTTLEIVGRLAATRMSLWLGWG